MSQDYKRIAQILVLEWYGDGTQRDTDRKIIDTFIISQGYEEGLSDDTLYEIYEEEEADGSK